MSIVFFVLIPYAIALLISAGVTVYAWRARRQPAVFPFFLFALSETLWSLGFIVETLSHSMETKIFWDNLQFITMMVDAAVAPVFAYEFGAKGARASKKRWLIAFAFPLIFLLIVYTDPWHGLIRPSTELVTEYGITSLYYPFTNVMMSSVLYTYFISFYSIYTILRAFSKEMTIFRRQAVIIILGLLVPMAGGILVIFEMVPPYLRDINPIAFGISNLLIAIGLLRYSLFDIVPIARDAVFEDIATSVIVLDQQNRIVDVNRSAIDLFRIEKGKIVGHPISDLIKNQPKLLDEYLFKQQAHGTISLEMPGRTLFYDLTITPLLEPHGIPLGRIVTLSDVTHHRETEHELHLRTEQLETAYKELEAFTYSVSHDLRAPLRAVDGYISLLKTDFPDAIPAQGQEYLKHVHENAIKMDKLINGLLRFSRIGRHTIRKTKTSLGDLASEVYEELRRQFPAERQIEFIVKDMPVAMVDPILFRQVFHHLIENALKFTGNRPQAEIEIGCIQKEGMPVYYVKDNGIGFDMKYATNLFGIFQNMHPNSNYEGTGIGLATVQRIINRHDGRVWAEAEVNGGATFYFTLLSGEARM